MSQNLQKIIVSLVIIFVLVGFFYYSFSGQLEKIKSEEISSVSTETIGGDILVIFDRLNSISLNTDILRSETFLSLKDFSVAISDEPQGRPNPFAIIGNDVGTILPVVR